MNQPTCAGCCLNPNWMFNPYNPYTNPCVFDYNLNTSPYQQYIGPTILDNFIRLTEEEKELLQKLKDAFDLYCKLDQRSDADNKEFVDAIHRLQQLVALRVAR